MSSVELPATAPFDFAQSLGFLCAFPPTSGEQHTENGALTKAFRSGGRTVTARITGTGSGVRCELQGLGPHQETAEIADRIGFYLSLADDLAPFYELGRKDPHFAPVIDQLAGYHQVKFPSPVENLVWAILVQRTPMPAAAAAKRALLDRFGQPAFPDLQQLMTLTEADWAALTGNPRKAGRLHASLHRWAETEETSLRTGPYDEVRDFLLGLPGIGPWSADFILIRGLGRMERISADKALVATASRAYGRSLSEQDVRAIADGYGPYQGYWGHYLRAAG
jgi:DNA-3-methyladenine glycosylase II